MITGKVQTRDLIYNRPYYVITYVESSSDNPEEKTRCKWVAHNALREFLDSNFATLIKAVKELESLYVEYEALEIDFKIEGGEVSVIHVRQLEEISDVPRVMPEKDFTDTKSFAKCSYLDTYHMLSDSVSWNPKRLLGDNPRPLEYSIFKSTADSGVWNDVIKLMGYEGYEDELVIKIANKPYVSINNYFNGLMPVGLSREVKYKLESYYEKAVDNIRYTGEAFEHHILFDTYGYNIKERLERLRQEGFSDEEADMISTALCKQTTKVVEEFHEKTDELISRIDNANKLRERIIEEKALDTTNSMKLNKYIDELITAIRTNIVPALIYNERCVSISQQFYSALADNDDSSRNALYSLSRELWSNVKQSDTYKGIFDIRNRVRGVMKKRYEGRIIQFSDIEMTAEMIKEPLKRAGIDIDAGHLVDMMVGSLKNARCITEQLIQALSLVTDMVIRLGDLLGIAYEDMSYLEIQDLIEYHSRDSYIQIIQSRRRMYHANNYLVLPELICNVGDIDIIDVE